MGHIRAWRVISQIHSRLARQQEGFSLVELAVVIMIVGLLLGGLIMPLSMQMEQQKVAETRKTIDAARDALLTFAAVNGRLPCPASSTSHGAESFGTDIATSTIGTTINGICSNFLDGYLPAVTLGLSPVDFDGYLIDGWQRRIRYVVSNELITSPGPPNFPYIFTSTNGMRLKSMATIAGLANLLTVCRANSVAVDCATANNLVTRQAPAIIFSLGRNGFTTGNGADEAQNLDNNTFFVSHEMAAVTAPNGEFDDMLTWFSINTLFGRMMTAGTLP